MKKKTGSSVGDSSPAVVYAPLRTERMPDRRFAVCFYPGIVENADEALRTLGGPSEIAKVLSQDGPPDGTEKDKIQAKEEAVGTLLGDSLLTARESGAQSSLKLKFDPDDPLCHAIVSHLDTRSGLVLEVSRDNVARGRDTDVCQARILGVVEKAHHFHALADFVSPEPEISQRYLSVESEIDYTLDTFPDDPVDMPLPLWSHVDLPQDYAFKQNMTKPRQRLEGEMDRRFLVNRQQPSHVVDFGVEAAAIPSKLTEDEERSPLEFAVLEHCLRHLFEKRPIWSRDAIEAHLRKVGADTVRNGLKIILPKLAYYFSSGPWRLLWVRRGYDPRIDSSGRFYQGLDFRVPKWVGVMTASAHSQVADQPLRFRDFGPHEVRARSKVDGFAAEERGDSETGGSSWVSESAVSRGDQLLEDSVLEESRVDEEELDKVPAADERKSRLSTMTREELDEMTAAPARSSHTFTLPPTQRQELFMLCDIGEGVADVRALLAKQDPQPVCEEHGGWYPKDFLDKIRALLKARLREMLGSVANHGEQLDPGGERGRSGERQLAIPSVRPPEPAVDRDDTSPFSLLGE